MKQPTHKVIWYTETAEGLGAAQIFFCSSEAEARLKYEEAQEHSITCGMSVHIPGEVYILGYAHDMVYVQELRK